MMLEFNAKSSAWTHTLNACAMAILLALATSALQGGVIVSDWTNPADGVDGWNFEADGTSFGRIDMGGNPGGFLQVSDLGQGGIIFFVAPGKFLGDRSAYYGGALSYDEQQSIGDRQTGGDLPEVYLTGNGISLYFLPNSNNPAVTPSWSSYNFALRASAGWFDDSTSLPASEAQMKSVLANLTSIEIRAEYSSGRDVDGLDNVVLTAVPEPATVGLVFLVLPVLLLRRRASAGMQR